MVANPMQRKAMTSFFLGMFITVLVMGAIVGFLLYKLNELNEKQKTLESSQKEAYVLSADVKSGESLTSSQFKKVVTMSEAIPTDATTTASFDENTIAKIDIKKGTILTTALVEESTAKTTNDLRVQEYNMLKLNSQIKTGDCIDIRLRMPSGLDYVVVSKKTVEVPQIDGVDSENTIWLKMTEDETLAMSNSIVEAYIMDGAILYTAAYVEPGMQEAAIPTYVPSASVQNLMNQDANIVQDAKNGLFTRYNNNASIRSNNINSELSNNSTDAQDKVKTGTTSEVTNAQTQRKSYLDALSGK